MIVSGEKKITWETEVTLASVLLFLWCRKDENRFYFQMETPRIRISCNMSREGLNLVKMY